MSDVAVSALPAVTAALLAQEVPANDAGTTRKYTLAQLLTLLQPGDSEASPGTSTTSATAVDTTISIPLEIGTYNLLGAGRWSSGVNGNAMRFTCAADAGLVVNSFCLVQTILTGNTSAQIGFTLALGTLTAVNTGGGATVRPWLLQGCIVVTTAGNLKLQIASETGGNNVTMVDGVFQAFRI
jgi:hypothetical protein